MEKITKQQIIDWVKAGFEVKIKSSTRCGVDFIITIKEVCGDGSFLIFRHKSGSYEQMLLGDSAPVISVRPRPITPLPDGTKVEFRGRTLTTICCEPETYVLNDDTVCFERRYVKSCEIIPSVV